MDGYVTKPIRLNELYSAIVAVSGNGSDALIACPLAQSPSQAATLVTEDFTIHFCRGEHTMNRERSIELLNKAVADELAAVHQYMYFHFHLDDQDFGPLAALFKRTAITEMGHVEKLAERILFLKGEVKMAVSGPVQLIVEPAEMLAKATAMEEGSANDYNKAAQECGASADAATKEIFESLVGDEEGHFDAFDNQLDHIRRFGPAYLALQSFGKPVEGGPAAE
jgi:bacterioferritin